MARKLFFFLVVFFSYGVVKAQEFSDLTPDQIPMMDGNWALVAMKKWKEVSPNKFVPIFPAPLKAKSNKTFALSGYMVVMKTGFTHSKFMLAVVPLAQCQFCGMNGIPDMVEIHMQPGHEIKYQNDPITIIGNLTLSAAENTANVLLLNAKVYK